VHFFFCHNSYASSHPFFFLITQTIVQLAEIKHGRLSMIAITAFAVQEFVSKVGVVDETPIFFKPLF